MGGNRLSHFGSAYAKKVVGITGNCVTTPCGDEFRLKAPYFDAVKRAGGIPLLLPPVMNEVSLREMLRQISALVFSGGPDVSPQRYGQEPHPRTDPVHPRRDVFDFRCLDMAIKMEIPILAICYGAQALNVLYGGTLIQDIPSQTRYGETHAALGDEDIFHRVEIEPNTKLARILGVHTLEVNSTHHQAIGKVAKGLHVSARSQKGIIEAIETVDNRRILGVQWHPERLVKLSTHLKLFKMLNET